MKTSRVTLTFLEPLLGTAPGDKEIYAKFIATKAASGTEDEVESCPTLENATTGFHRDASGPFLYDYQIKGFFKDACSMLARVKDSASNKLKAYKKTIDGLLFIQPRRVYLNLSGPITTLERPLRAQTAQGERIALARSEAAPAGTTVTCELLNLGIAEELIKEWLTYGALRGLGQWRNASFGKFEYLWQEVA